MSVKKGKSDFENIKTVLGIASRSPSAHNTQPWKFTIANGNKIDIHLDEKHVLKEGDPSKRQTWLSLGALSETLEICLKEFGFRYKQRTDLDADNFLSFQITAFPNVMKMTKKTQLIHQRSSNRHPFKKQIISSEMLDKINKKFSATSVVTSDDKNILQTTASLNKKALTIALSSPNFRSELYAYVHISFGNHTRGLPGYVLGLGILRSVLEKFVLKTGLLLQIPIRREYHSVRNSPAFAFILSEGDTKSDWFNAGKVYMQTSLQLAELGFDQATIGGPVEASDFHEDIELLLGTKQRLQAIIRFGHTTKKNKKPSPRTKLDDLIST